MYYRSMKLILISLCFALASSASIVYKECSVEDLGSCIFNVQKRLFHELLSIDGNQTVGGVFCDIVIGKQGQCLSERVEACKDDHPKASKFMSTMYDYYNFSCSDDGKVFQNLLNCTVYNIDKYPKCFSNEKNTQDMDYGFWTKICTGNSSMQHCMAKFIKDTCKLGEEFENVVENIIRAQADLNVEVCLNRTEEQKDLKAYAYIERAELLEKLQTEALDELKAEAVDCMNGAEPVKISFKILIVIFISLYLSTNKFY